MLLLACFLWPSLSSYTARAAGLGMALPTVNWALLLPSTPLSLSRPHGGGALSVKVPYSEQTPVSVNLTENYPPLSVLTPFLGPAEASPHTLWSGSSCQKFTPRLLTPASPPWRTGSGEQLAVCGEGEEVWGSLGGVENRMEGKKAGL